MPRGVGGATHDLAIITVSTNEAHWIRPLPADRLRALGDIRADVVVVDNDSRDGTADVVADRVPRGAHGVVAPTTASGTRTTAR